MGRQMSVTVCPKCGSSSQIERVRHVIETGSVEGCYGQKTTLAVKLECPPDYKQAWYVYEHGARGVLLFWTCVGLAISVLAALASGNSTTGIVLLVIFIPILTLGVRHKRWEQQREATNREHQPRVESLHEALLYCHRDDLVFREDGAGGAVPPKDMLVLLQVEYRDGWVDVLTGTRI